MYFKQSYLCLTRSVYTCETRENVCVHAKKKPQSIITTVLH